MPDKVFNSGRLQEVAPGEYAPEVYARDAWSTGGVNGRARIRLEHLAQLLHEQGEACIPVHRSRRL